MFFTRFFTLLLFFLSSNGNPIFSQQKENAKEAIQTFCRSKKNPVAELRTYEQLRNKKVVSLSVILIIILFFLFYFFYQNNKLKQKIKRKDIKQKILINVINAGIDNQEMEQKKIAAFLHDNVNALLSSAGLHLNVFTTQNNINSEEIKKTKAILAEAHDLLRDMSHDLVPALLVRFGLIYALEDLCERNSNSNIAFEFSSTIPIEKRYIEKFEMKLYFIVSELFNNIIKHSEAKKTTLSLVEKNNQFVIAIHDNGKGFSTKKTKDAEGFGLNRIRARIKKFKGSFTVDSKPNEGTMVKIKIPLPH
ncbi:Histidine kinase-, DNA gyrase B-, and HSP90-like ATPase [Flavobacterium aquidurense]|uniref:histidine kinase n=1 Tax=Flavobacterium frigidimaris TaxID=262320 RepID=A0ABX4BTG6_FLAFR|nr:ATP-binding protein [Flavobacterium frigidimaris]OXA80402.1 histidine kinase [Flavobacterium frigidimaris]SDY75885.1 Histidine kinase-, DNA gyrase B-, and HSP90-like ATPase [Flavobacterium aquidurense]